MLVVNVTSARAIVSLYGSWPLQPVYVVPDPPMYLIIFPAILEWARN